MTINIKGNEYYLKCNMYALEVFTSKLDLRSKDSITAVYATMWALLKGGAYVKGEELNITFEKLVDWIDANRGNEDIREAADYWADSFVYQRWIDEVLGKNDSKVKKKIGTKLKR